MGSQWLQFTGAHFLEFVSIKLDVDERPEDLLQRLKSLIDDNLLVAISSIIHHGDAITTDDELSPTLKNLVVLTWWHSVSPFSSMFN